MNRHTSSMPPPSGTVYRRSPDAIETDLGGELILLDPATQEMFSLNPTGRLVWRELDGVPLHAVAERVAAAFEVAQEDAERDIEALIVQLLATGLVRPAPAG